MGVGAGLCMYDVVVKKFTFAISSPYFHLPKPSEDSPLQPLLSSCQAREVIPSLRPFLLLLLLLMSFLLCLRLQLRYVS